MPEGFGFLDSGIDAYVPFAFTPEQRSDAARGNQFSNSVGRLAPGATIEGLNAELDSIVRRNVAEGRLSADAITEAGFTGRAQPLRDLMVGSLGDVLGVLQAIVIVVLLIACANLANLQLTRVTSRRKELALRSALGAGNERLCAWCSSNRCCSRSRAGRSASPSRLAGLRWCARSVSIAPT